MRNKKVLGLTIDAFFLAIIFILSFVPYTGYISIPGIGISITILHVIVLVGAMCFGFTKGLLYGAFFGIASLIRAISMPNSVIDPLFWNPLVSILPRMIFGGLAGFTFSLIKKLKNKPLVYILLYINSGLMSLVHSFLTLSMLYLFNMNDPNVTGGGYGGLLFSIITLNGIIELVLAIVVAPNIALALFRAYPSLTKSPFFQDKGDLNMLFSKKINYDSLLENYHEESIENLKKLIAINSCYDKESVSKENPFGKGVSQALDFICTLAKNDGFQATNYDNKVVEITYGSGSKDVMILAHTDVVPATGKWTHDPFDMDIRDGILYGRGVSDDKGPLMSCYYALKAIKQYDLAKGYQIRLVVGGNEESGSLCMEHYFHTLNKKQPTYGFTPDSDWPVVYGEKGIMNFHITADIDFKNVLSIKSGVVINAVIDKTIICIDSDDLFNYFQLNNMVDESTFKDGVYQIIHYGKSAHGSTPELGKNSSIELLNVLKQYYKNDKITSLIDKITPLDGKGLKIDGFSKDMGHNSFNVGTLNYENKTLSIGVNFRFVNGYSDEQFKNIIKEQLDGYQINFEPTSQLLFFDKKSPLVKTLTKSYKRISKDKKSKPITIGGGTYAKEAQNTVAFGMQFKNFDTHMHEADERLRLSDFYLSMKIYLDAILSLGNLIKKDEN